MAASAGGARPTEDTADPMRVWFRFVRLNRRVGSAMAAVLREVGLSIPQFDLVSTLGEREGLTQGELAARLYVTKGNVSGLVDRLAAAGLAAQEAYVARTLGRLPPADLAALERVVLAWRDRARAEEDAAGRD